MSTISGPRPIGIVNVATHLVASNLITLTPSVINNWPTANKAFYATIYVPGLCVATKLFWVNGTTLNGNFDMAIYDAVSLKRLTSMTPVSQAGFSGVTQITTLASPVTLRPGEYLLGISGSGTGRICQTGLGATRLSNALLLYEQTSAHPLPDPAVPVACTAGFVLPYIGFFTDQCGLTT